MKSPTGPHGTEPSMEPGCSQLPPPHQPAAAVVPGSGGIPMPPAQWFCSGWLWLWRQARDAAGAGLCLPPAPKTLPVSCLMPVFGKSPGSSPALGGGHHWGDGGSLPVLPQGIPSFLSHASCPLCGQDFSKGYSCVFFSFSLSG